MKVHLWFACLFLLLAAAVRPVTAETVAEPVFTPSAETVEARRKAVEEEAVVLGKAKVQLETLRQQRQQQLQKIDDLNVSQAMMHEARLAMEGARLKLESTELDMAAVDRGQKELETRIRNQKEALKALQAASRPAAEQKVHAEAVAQAQARLAADQSLIEIESQHSRNLAEELSQAQERLRLAKVWSAALQEKLEQTKAQVRQEALDELEQRIRLEQQALSERMAKLRNTLGQLSGEGAKVQSERRLLETQIKETEEQHFLLQLRLKSARVTQIVTQTELSVENEDLPTEGLKAATESLQQVVDELRAAERLAQGKKAVLVQQGEVISKRRLASAEERKNNSQEQRIVDGLIAGFNKQLLKTGEVLTEGAAQLNTLEAAYKASANRSLTARHRLADEQEVWGSISRQLAALPRQMLQAYSDLLRILWDEVEKATPLQGLTLLVLQLFWLGTWLWLGLSRVIKQRLDQVQASLEQDPFSSKGFLIGMKLLRCNKTPIGLAVSLLLYHWLIPLPDPWRLLAVALVAVWLGARLVIGLAYWLLVSPVVEESQRHPTLYRWLFWAVLAGSVLSLIMAFAYQGFLDLPARELLGRFFLLFLFLPAYLFVRIQRLLINRLRERSRTTYWIRLIQVVSTAIPLSMFASSILGLIGYVNLAWSVAGHLAVFLAVLVVWLTVRGLLRDLTNAGKNYAVVTFERGLLITQAVINPLYLLAKVGLFITAVWLLFRFYGWGSESAVIISIKEVLATPLVTFGEVTVTLKQALGSLILVVLVVLFGRWIRQVTYRWFYVGVEDLGLRNSLAVFTQYSIVLLGLVIALNTLGLDLTSLAIFTGALGIGIGFGLQNIANNFISGIILLMERPIRAADWVTIGNYEGEVASIGIRSVTVTTWDNQDVIIPNADIVSNPFVNWTRTDQIVRTVLVIGISYHNDPHKAVEVIQQAVASVPGVLGEPEPRIWLQEFGDSSVNIRVHYFMDVKKESRLEVKSKVMFAIWDALKANGINIPFPQQDIYIKEIPKGLQGLGFKESGEEPA